MHTGLHCKVLILIIDNRNLIIKSVRKKSKQKKCMHCTDSPKRRVKINAFMTSEFLYCLLIWMVHSAVMKTKSTDSLKKPYDLFTLTKQIYRAKKTHFTRAHLWYFSIYWEKNDTRKVISFKNKNRQHSIFP